MRLHLGCGRTRRDGWVNIDSHPIDGVTDQVIDLDGDGLATAFAPGTVDETVGIHLLEHLQRPLALMEALWAVTKPGGTATFETPYGSSDDAWEDPTHVRPYFLGSWGYFSQPHYWRADYGYRGDWEPTRIVLAVDPGLLAQPRDDLIAAIHHGRNVVRTMTATLECVKPARPPHAELQTIPTVDIVAT